MDKKKKRENSLNAGNGISFFRFFFFSFWFIFNWFLNILSLFSASSFWNQNSYEYFLCSFGRSWHSCLNFFTTQVTVSEAGSSPFTTFFLRNSGIVPFLVFASHTYQDKCFWLLLDWALLQLLDNCVISHFTISLYTSSVKRHFVPMV